MTEGKYSIGDPVWSKMKGYCPWPSRIAAPTESALENKVDKLKNSKIHYLVYFFGSNNFAWMPEDTIKPYDEFKDKNKNGSKTSQFKSGLKEIEEYIASDGKSALLQQLASEAIKNTDDAASKSADDDEDDDESSNNDNHSNQDGDLPSIDEEIAAINNKKLASARKTKNDSLNDSLTSPLAGVQKDYSRTPFKSRKTTRPDESSSELSSPSKRVKNDDESTDNANLTSPINTATSKPPTGKTTGARNALLRASHYTDAPTVETPQISMGNVSAKLKNIRPSRLKFGFIGLGFMGQRLLKNLLNSGHQVTIWNRTAGKCKEFLDAGASSAKTPADVVIASDVVFSCLSDPVASKEVVFGTFGVLSDMDSGKSYVELSSIDIETNKDISDAIIGKGGRYLAGHMILNGKKAAEDGELVIVAAGDKSLYEECSSCFQAIAKQTFFLGGSVEYATKMNLIFSMLYGAMTGALVECVTLVERCELQSRDFKEILKLSVMNCPLTSSVLDKIINNDDSVQVPLGHLQKDLRLALNLAEEYDQSCPITAITNEVFKNSKRFGYGEHDASAVYHRSRY